MPDFVNNNRHRIYVHDGESLQRVNPGEEVSASGEYADNLAGTAGVEQKKGKAKAKAGTKAKRTR